MSHTSSLRRQLRAFTLIELNVVMAIIVTLSVIGFISYNSYIRDARNATRVSHMDEATAAIDRFVFNNGRAPKCRGNTATSGSDANNLIINGPAVCYFAPDTGTGVPDTSKAKGPTVFPVGLTGYLPCAGTGCSGGNTGTMISYGVDAASGTNDWGQLNLKSNPADPRNVYYLYATDGGSAYAIFATKEETSGYSPIVRGYKAMIWDAAAVSPNDDKVKLGLNYTGSVTVPGWVTTNGTFGSTTAAILGDGNLNLSGDTTGPVPYTW